MASQEPTDEQMNMAFLSMYLDTVSENFENIVDTTLDDVIASKINNQKAYNLKSKKREINTPIDEYEALDNEVDEYMNHLYEVGTLRVISALYELKIIYLYKYFEIRLKELSSVSFKKWPTDREVFRWDDIIKFYLSNDIVLKNFNNYQSVFDLGRVNNSLKHMGNKISKKIRNIPEFRGTEFIEFGHLQAFYERVNEAPKDFIKELAFVISSKIFTNEMPESIDLGFDKSDFRFDFDEPDTEITYNWNW